MKSFYKGKLLFQEHTAERPEWKPLNGFFSGSPLRDQRLRCLLLLFKIQAFFRSQLKDSSHAASYNLLLV